jgi:enediyne biosynthesis protein E4
LYSPWADPDNDGDLDLLLVGYEGDQPIFMENGGGGIFTRQTVGMDWTSNNIQVRGWATAWGDLDNDGFLDLFITGPGHCRLFRNTTDGNLVEVMVGSPVSDPSNAQSAAWADYDNDGDLDLFVACLSSRNYLYQNNGNANNWLKVRLKGTASNSHGVGAKVFARTTEGLDARQMRQITAGSVSQELEAHFGLGDATKVDTLRIEWPSGIVQELTDVAVDQILQVVESQHLTLPEPLSIQSFELDATGVFHATVNCSIDGAVCVLESSSDLERWTKVRVGTSSGGTVELTDARGGDSPGKFYRVLVP